MDDAFSVVYPFSAVRVELDGIIDIQELKNNDCLFIWNNVLNSETVPN